MINSRSHDCCETNRDKDKEEIRRKNIHKALAKNIDR